MLTPVSIPILNEVVLLLNIEPKAFNRFDGQKSRQFTLHV